MCKEYDKLGSSIAMNPCISVELSLVGSPQFLMPAIKDFYLTHLTVSSLISPN